MSAGVGAGNGISCPTCRSPFTIDLNQVQENEDDDSALSMNKEKISRIGLPSLQELPHVASGKSFFVHFVCCIDYFTLYLYLTAIHYTHT